MPLPYLHLAIVSTLATAETPSNMLEEAEPTEQQSNQQLEDENGDTDSGFSWNLYKGERARRVMGGQGVDGTLAQRIQPATTAQFPGYRPPAPEAFLPRGDLRTFSVGAGLQIAPGLT